MSVFGSFKITHEQAYQFLVLFDREKKFPNQRIGQAFCNHFNIVWPEVFYNESRFDTLDLIYNTVVK